MAPCGHVKGREGKGREGKGRGERAQKNVRGTSIRRDGEIDIKTKWKDPNKGLESMEQKWEDAIDRKDKVEDGDSKLLRMKKERHLSSVPRAHTGHSLRPFTIK